MSRATANLVEDTAAFKDLEVGVISGSIVGLGLTASSGSIQGGTPLTASFNVIDTVGTAGDSVTLPLNSKLSTIIFIKNGAGANAMDVFPALGDDLGAGANTAASLLAGKGIAYIKTAATVWEALFAGA